MCYKFRKKRVVWVTETRIDPKFPLNANFKRSTEVFLFAERRRIKIFRPNEVCKCFILVNDLGIIHWEVLPNSVLPRQTMANHWRWGIFFNGEVPSNNTTQNQTITHANLLISGKFCSLPVLLRYEILTRHEKHNFFRVHTSHSLLSVIFHSSIHFLIRQPALRKLVPSLLCCCILFLSGLLTP